MVNPQIPSNRMLMAGEVYPIIRIPSNFEEIIYQLGFQEGENFSMSTILYNQLKNYQSRHSGGRSH